MGAWNTDFGNMDSRAELLRQLQRLVGKEGQELRVKGQVPEQMLGSQPSTIDSPLSTGLSAVDRLLPGGGLRRGSLVEWVNMNHEARMTNDEWLSSHSSFVIHHSEITPSLPVSLSPSLTLPLLAAREACREGGLFVLVDRARTFYPPAAAAWGIDLARLLVVRPKTARDALWATVQALRSPAVAAVWAAFERIDDRAFRRLQLAAQSARAIGLLSQPASARGQPTWADVRLGVEMRQGDRETWRQGENDGQKLSRSPGLLVSMSSSNARLLQIHLLRCRHGRAGGLAEVEIDDAAYVVREAKVSHDAHPLPVVPQLADPTLAAYAERRA